MDFEGTRFARGMGISKHNNNNNNNNNSFILSFQVHSKTRSL